ncbi:MAG: M48 family metalloprotease [Armatimonadetes bacterium]|nr:M48 family metalloprotease [Armatimonadota bacterium]
MLSAQAHPAGLETEIEKIIGRQVASLFEAQLGRADSPTLSRWVERIGRDAARVSPRQDIRYTFIVINTREANAYAAPGAYIFVTRGLLDVVESEDELAAILAHEVAHVAQRHAMRQIETQLLVGLGLGRLDGSRHRTAIVLVQVLNALVTLHTSRCHEAEADRAGFEIAYQAGYDPAAMLSFFERIGQGGPKESKLEQLFATHPPPSDRLAAARRNPRVAPVDAGTHLHLAQGYERRGFPVQAVRHYLQAARLEPELPDASLGLARSLNALGRREEAVSLWRDMARRHPGDGDIRAGLEAAESLPAEESNRQAGLPAIPPTSVTSAGPEMEALRAKEVAVMKGLNRVYRSHRITAGLQQSLLISPALADPRWSALAYEAFKTVERLEDAYAKAARAARSALDLAALAIRWSRWLEADGAPRWPGGPEAVGNAKAVRDICLELMEAVEKLLPALSDGGRTVQALLLDLASPFLLRAYDPNLTRYSLEAGLALHARQQAARAGVQAGRAYAEAARSRLTLLRMRLDALYALMTRDQKQSALRRLARWFPSAREPDEAGFGAYAFRLALAQETGEPPEKPENIRQNAENLYTILRMIEQELMKETFPSEPEQSIVDDRLNRSGGLPAGGRAADAAGEN